MSDDVDVSDRTQVRAARRSAAAEEREEGERLAAFLGQPIARRWMWRLLEACHTFSTSFDDNPYRTAFREGERNVGIRILADIMRNCPHQYSVMTQEAENVRSSPKPKPPASGPKFDQPFSGLASGFTSEYDPADDSA
jgi:hypothetical protein